MIQLTTHSNPPLQIILGIDEPLAQQYIMEGSNYSEEMREALKPGVTRNQLPILYEPRSTGICDRRSEHDS